MSSTVPPTPEPQPSDRPQDGYGSADPYRAPTTPPPAGGTAVPPPYEGAPAPYQAAPAPYQAAPAPYQDAAPQGGAPYGGAPDGGAPYAGAPYGGAPAQPGTDGFAITSLVTGLLSLSLVAVGFGIAALRRISRSGRSGKGMAIAGIVLGGLSTLAWGAVIALAVAVAGSEEFQESFAEGFSEGFTEGSVEGFDATTSYAVGQCMNFPDDATSPTEVACAEPHTGEIVGTRDMTESSYPGEDAAYAAAEEFCLEAFAGYVGIDFMESELDMLYLYPTETSWGLGDRQIVCWVEPMDGAPLTESVAGAAW